MKLINFLRTPTAILIALGAALLAQLPHAADVFRLVVVQPGMAWGWAGVLHSYLYAIALEVAILVFVVNGWNKISYAFAAVSIGANLAYYYLHGVNLFSVAALPVWFISIALPAAIALYSHLLADEADAVEPHDEAPAIAEELQPAEATELQSSTDTPEPVAAPHTKPSSRLFDASRLAPCNPVQDTSPQAYRPCTLVRPASSTHTPPTM
jgi:hypothetical protein